MQVQIKDVLPQQVAVYHENLNGLHAVRVKEIDVEGVQVANAAAELVSAVPEANFLTLEGSGDPADSPAPDGIKSAHRFAAAMNLEENEGIQELFRILSGLMPPGAFVTHD